MKKRFELIKTIQLIIYLAITALGLFEIFSNGELYQMVGRNSAVRFLCILFWIALVGCFIFIYWDFSTHSSFKKDYRELDYAVYNDHIAGIANRYSCDAMIEKYLDRPLPDTVGCVMLDITNLRDINANYGHLKGNETIQEFSNYLHTASVGICFVGRNGGNKFMALFEDCDEVKINAFLTRVNQKVQMNNMNPGVPKIEYRTGRAFRESSEIASITQLIALADRRLNSHTDTVGGIPNRYSCDDIINLYLDKPLPDNLGCIMLDITNIRDINDAHGYLEGNRVIRQFGDILQSASNGLCFVGRNGGTKFLAIFESCDNQKIHTFLDRVRDMTNDHNKLNDVSKIEYMSGTAFHEGPEIKSINRLIALADRRSRGEEE